MDINFLPPIFQFIVGILSFILVIWLISESMPKSKKQKQIELLEEQNKLLKEIAEKNS